MKEALIGWFVENLSGKVGKETKDVISRAAGEM